MYKKDNEQYKRMIIDYIDQCFMTTIIGAIAAVEGSIDKENFVAIRKKILDLGHDNRRNAGRALDKSGIFKSQYSYVFEKEQE